MNRGLKSYGIFLVMITTLVFILTDFGVVNATTSANQNPSTQSNGLPELNHDSGDKNQCDDCNNNDNNNNNNDNNNNNNDNDDNNDNGDDSSISNSNNNNNNNNNNDDSSISSTSSSSSNANNNNNNGKESTNSGDVPMSLPFNSNVGEQSDDSEKDYSSVIPFP